MDLLSCSEHLLDLLRQGVYYLSVAAAGFLVFIIVLAILKGGRNSYLTNILCVKEDGAICYINTTVHLVFLFYLSYENYLKNYVLSFFCSFF
jgi:hypothetical protein